MVKQRMGAADVAGEVSCLKQRLLGLRLANIYDLNAKTYVLKLAKSGSDGEKVFLLLESGTRFHTVQVMYDKPDAPSNLTLKLRKHLRTRRLEDVRQLGVDRVVDFVFGCGENAHHLILEMYAQGNVILTDSSYQVLTLLRSHRDDDKGLSIMAKHPYPMHAIRLRQPLPLDTLRAALAAAAAPPAAAAAGSNGDAAAGAAGANGSAAAEPQASEDEEDDDGDEGPTTARKAAAAAAAATAAAAGGKKGRKAAAAAAGPLLKSVVADLVPYGPAIAEHCCLSAGLSPSLALQQQQLSEEQLLALYAAVQGFEAWLAGLDQGATAEGFVSAVPAPAGKAQQQQGAQQQQQGDGQAPERGDGLVYQDYNPLRLEQLGRCQELLSFASFDEALDEFYSKIQGQRVQVAKLEAERQALSRLDKIRSDQGARATALEREAAASQLRATLIEYNLAAVDAAIDAVNAAIATGMDWRELEALIREERRNGNPVAGTIHSLQLDQNKITLLLSNLLDEEEDDEEALTRPATKVDVDLGQSAYSNAAAHHASRKKQEEKQGKTLAAHAEALKAAQKKAAHQLANLRNSATTAQVVRKAAWYERFHWFISSENYLIISGRDAQQNELIVKRYFRKDDVYVHAELHGASSTIVRNHDPSRPVPPLTLQQAGCACVCRSKAWDNKIVTSAWWVHHHQVSKAAPTGEYLPTGSFMIRGRKNFLPPQGLVMGFGFMFKLEESCIGRHAGERAVRGGLDADEQDAQQQVQQGGQAEEAEEEEQEGSSEAGTLSAAASSSTSALEAFLDMSADQLAAGASRRASGAGAGPAASSSSTAAGFQRYGLDHPAAAGGDGAAGEDEGSHSQAAQAQAESKRYVTAAERARLKKAAKGGSTGQQQQQQQQRDKGQKSGKAGGDGGKPPAGPSAAAAAATAMAAAAAQKSQRGKKAKAAKAKERYAEQDEEERALALQLLGSSGARKTRQERRQQRKASRDETRQAAQGGSSLGAADLADAIKKATGSQFADLNKTGEAPAANDGSGSDSGAEAPEQQRASPAAAANGSSGSSSQPAAAGEGSSSGAAAGSSAASDDDADDAAEVLAAAADEAERAEISALLAEENVAELPYESGDAAAAALMELDSLTGLPRGDDVLMHAVAVVGPYAAMANYKFKVKLTPGTLKKGKAVKQALDVLVRSPDVTNRERELLRAVPDTDMINAMLGSVKISASGLQQIKAASKKAKKAAAQSRNAASS